MKPARVFSSIYDILIKTGIGDSYIYPLSGSGILKGASMRSMTKCLDELPVNYWDDSLPRKLVIGNALFAIGKYEAAATLFESISNVALDNSESCFNLALCMVRMQEPELAVNLFNELALKLPSFCEIYYQRAKVYDSIGESDQALENYVTAAKLYPGHVRAKFNMGLLLARIERHEEAVVQFSQVLVLRPGLANAYLNRGVSSEELGSFNTAMEDYTMALSIDPLNENALFNRARVNYHLGRLEAARSDYSDFLRLVPNDPEAYNNRGLVFDALGNEEAAIRDYDQALLNFPEFSEALNNKGAALENIGDLDLALNLYLAAIDANPDYSSAYFNAAKIYVAKGQLVLAEEYLHRSVVLNREHLPEAIEDEQLGWLIDVQGIKYSMGSQ